jgi:hypothetical protein
MSFEKKGLDWSRRPIFRKEGVGSVSETDLSKKRGWIGLRDRFFESKGLDRSRRPIFFLQPYDKYEEVYGQRLDSHGVSGRASHCVSINGRLGGKNKKPAHV